MSDQVRDRHAPKLDGLVDRLYRHRFPPTLASRRADTWRIICRSWLARYIPRDARVLEVGAGYCEFINNIAAIERVAVDINPETRANAADGVVVHEIDAERLADVVPLEYFDVAFISNFLEHCRSRDAVLRVLAAVHDVLKPRGRLLVLGPNFRYCYRRYFDYFDHHLALTDNAVAEALELTGFAIAEVLPRTLPFSFRGRLPAHRALVRAYLRARWLWPVFGAQFFVVGLKRDGLPTR